jgi:hypothetical protein
MYTDKKGTENIKTSPFLNIISQWSVLLFGCEYHVAKGGKTSDCAVCTVVYLLILFLWLACSFIYMYGLQKFMPK